MTWSNYDPVYMSWLKSIDGKLEKLIEIQERPYKEQERVEQIKKQEAHAKYISDLIDPKHYEK